MRKSTKALALGLVLGLWGGGALAHEGEEPQAPAPPPEAPKRPAPVPKSAPLPKAPETCQEQCELISDPCKKPCKTVKGGGRGACEASCQNVVDLCLQSCREKGRIDPDYIKKRLKPPGAGG